MAWLAFVDEYGVPPPTARALSNVTGCGTVVLPQNFRFVLRDDAVSLSARRVHLPFPAYASGLVADVQAVLNEVISAEGQFADVANESLKFFISRSLPAPPPELPPGESHQAIHKRTAHLQTEPVARRSSGPAAPPVVQAPAAPAPAESEPMSVEAPLPDASVEPADGQGDDVAHGDAASGAASDAAGGSSDAKNEGADASDDRDAAEDDIAADLLMEEILGLLGPESESESPES